MALLGVQYPTLSDDELDEEESTYDEDDKTFEEGTSGVGGTKQRFNPVVNRVPFAPTGGVFDQTLLGPGVILSAEGRGVVRKEGKRKRPTYALWGEVRFY